MYELCEKSKCVKKCGHSQCFTFLCLCQCSTARGIAFLGCSSILSVRQCISNIANTVSGKVSDVLSLSALMHFVTRMKGGGGGGAMKMQDLTTKLQAGKYKSK